MLFYHVSPTANRASIEALGLRAHHLGQAISVYDGRPYQRPRPTVFAIAGQPHGTYLAHDRAGAEEYARHCWDRFSARGRFGCLDVWEVHLPEGIDCHVDGDWYTSASVVFEDIPPACLTRVGMLDGAEHVHRSGRARA